MCIITFTYVTIMNNQNTPKSGQVNYSSKKKKIILAIILCLFSFSLKKTATSDSKQWDIGLELFCLWWGWSQFQRCESGNCLEEVFSVWSKILQL